MNVVLHLKFTGITKYNKKTCIYIYLHTNILVIKIVGAIVNALGAIALGAPVGIQYVIVGLKRCFVI